MEKKHEMDVYMKFFMVNAVFQLENEKGRAPGRALCAKWAREGTF